MLIISSSSSPSSALLGAFSLSCSSLIFTKTPILNSFNASFTPVAISTLSVLPTSSRRSRKCIVVNKASAVENQSATTVASSPPSTNVVDSGADVVRNFYVGINAHDVDSVEDLIAQNCVYEDLVFPKPFVGRKEIVGFFRKFTNSTSTDLQFVIDDLSTHDSSSVGVIWHLEWKGKPFPFSKGCSFYRLEVINGKRQITYGRDIVEPAIKPGDAVLAVIRSVTWLLQQFPQLADRL